MIEKLIQIFRLKEEKKFNAEEEIENAFKSLGEDILRLEIGSDLRKLSEIIMEVIQNVRDELKNETGFIFPPVHILEKDELQENEFVIFTQGREVLREFAIPNKEKVREELHQCLTRVFWDNIDSIFTMEICEKYINKVLLTNSWLIWSITTQIRTYEIKTVLVNIIKAKKSISNINLVFEKMEECLAENRSCCKIWAPDVISEKICREI